MFIETEIGEVIETLTGSVSDYTTDYLEGDPVVIRLKSDYAVPSWGFKVDRYEVIRYE